MAGAADIIPEVALVSLPSSSSSFLQHKPLLEARRDPLTLEPWLGDATCTANATIPCTGTVIFAWCLQRESPWKGTGASAKVISLHGAMRALDLLMTLL